VNNTDIKRALKIRIGTAKAVINNEALFMLYDQYWAMQKQEQRVKRSLKFLLSGIPVYDNFLVGVHGCGERISAEIIAYIDITKAEYVSSLWKLCGLDVARDGAGRSRRAEHLEDREYLNKDGEKATRKSITFNPKLKRSMFFLSDQFVRSPDSHYGKILTDYKHRITNDPKHTEKSKGHIHAMAKRYASKMFLADLYANWRRIEGLPVAPTYAEAKLGLIHGSAEKYA
jgi:hypothetical protein